MPRSRKKLFAAINHPCIGNLVETLKVSLNRHDCEFLICTDTGMPGQKCSDHGFSSVVKHVSHNQFCQSLKRSFYGKRHDSIYIFGLYYERLINEVTHYLNISTGTRNKKVVYIPLGGDLSESTAAIEFDLCIIPQFEYSLYGQYFSPKTSVCVGHSHLRAIGPQEASLTMPDPHRSSGSFRSFLIGNSADPCYRHDEILRLILEYTDERWGHELIIPFSYHRNNANYILSVESECKNFRQMRPRARLRLIDEFMNSVEYNHRVLSKITDYILASEDTSGWSQLSYVIANGGSPWILDSNQHVARLKPALSETSEVGRSRCLRNLVRQAISSEALPEDDNLARYVQKQWFDIDSHLAFWENELTTSKAMNTHRIFTSRTFYFVKSLISKYASRIKV